MKNNIFLKKSLSNIPRLLGQLNRNVSSCSYGSFDRAYWHYRINDISSARYQEAVLTLTLLYTYNFEGNIYYNNKNILEWINAALEFTCSIQNKDGSFNEWYLNEKSYVCTAFVSAALSETILILKKENIREYEKILDCLNKSAGWLMHNSENLVFNQLAGSVLALANIAELTNNESYRISARDKFLIIKQNQSSEGWWSEYKGPDAGYLSLMIDYLTKYYKIEQSNDVLDVLKKANAFLVNFLHPNLTVGGEYMSRNTEYIIPSGLAFLANMDNNAEIITAFNICSLDGGSGLGPVNLDDRYTCYILYNWLQAGIFLSQNNYNPSIDIKDYLKCRKLNIFFKDSGLRVIQNDKYYFVANLNKGGAFRLYAGQKIYLDSGIEIKYQGKRLISNVLDYNNKIQNKINSMEVEGVLKPIKEALMATPLMILFKTWQMLFGKIGGLQKLLKSFLRKKMITYKNSVGVSFRREFIFADNNVTVKDEVNAQIAEKDFYCGQKTSYNFIPSSKYFTIQEVNRDNSFYEKQYISSQDKSILRRVFNFN
ncbi:MAG: hypothetical protein WC323_01630 [Patescibacteria group bacterium]|jgi:hypothetical protein